MDEVENPYTNTIDHFPPDSVDYDELDTAYISPSLEESAPDSEYFGNWAPKLTDGVTGIPDGTRLQNYPSRDHRPEADQPPRRFWDRFNNDKIVREDRANETLNAIGWEEGKGARPQAPNPNLIPVPEDRPTMRMSPMTFAYTRLFDQGMKGLGAREFNGMHMSMADHRRDYDIFGMTPPKSGRNTYRLTPAPWDTDIIDMPPESDPDNLNARFQDVEVPTRNRSWRLQ